MVLPQEPVEFLGLPAQEGQRLLDPLAHGRTLQMLELLPAHGDLGDQLAAAGQDLAQLRTGRVGHRRGGRAHHRAIARDQPGIDPVGLGFQAHATGEVAHPLRVDDGGQHPLRHELAMGGPLIATGGLHHHQAGGMVAERADQRPDPGRIVADPKAPARAGQVSIQPGLADVQADDLRLLLCSIPVPSLSAGLRRSTVRAHLDAGRDHADARARTLGSFRSPTPRTHPLQGLGASPFCHSRIRQGSFGRIRRGVCWVRSCRKRKSFVQKMMRHHLLLSGRPVQIAGRE